MYRLLGFALLGISGVAGVIFAATGVFLIFEDDPTVQQIMWAAALTTGAAATTFYGLLALHEWRRRRPRVTMITPRPGHPGGWDRTG
jgi:hypothetical protein